MVFQTDNTYIIAGPQGAPGSCTPDGGAVVDNNGKSGLSDAGGRVPFTITGPSTVTIDNISGLRLVP